MSRYDRASSTVVVTPLDLSADKEAAVEFLNKRVDEKGEGKRVVSVSTDKWAICETPLGVYALCTEGVGPKSPVTDENPLEVDVYVSSYEPTAEEAETGKKAPTFIPLFPSAAIRLTPAKLLERATEEPVKLEEWVRSFGARLEANYSMWRETLEKALEGRQRDEQPA